MSYGYKGWKGKWEHTQHGYNRVYRHKDSDILIFKGKKSFWYYRDSPGGQRSHVSFDFLRDAINSLGDNP